MENFYNDGHLTIGELTRHEVYKLLRNSQGNPDYNDLYSYYIHRLQTAFGDPLELHRIAKLNHQQLN